MVILRNSGIEWTDHTFNPWIGCTKVSPGCKNCYAEALDQRRFSKLQVFGNVGHWGPGAPRHLAGDASWRQPRVWNASAQARGVRERVFCASLADVFDEEAPEDALDALWQLIRETLSLDWLLLTKRPERIKDSLPPDWGEGYANVWLGTSVEDQQRADERVPVLLSVPATVRFLSVEPLLGPVRLRGGVDWLLVGGESGPGARPFDVAWARELRDQRGSAAFHFKQYGHLANNPDKRDPTAKENGGSTKGGRTLDGATWDELPVPRLVTA